MGTTTRTTDNIALRIKEIESPGMWQDFYVQNQPFSKVSGYENDFHSWVADEWTITEVGTSLQNLNDLRNGVLSLTSGGTENDGSNCQLGGASDSETVGESFAAAAGKNLWFEARIKSNDVTEHDFFLGLSVQDTSVIASNGAGMIGFITHDGDALLDTITGATTFTTGVGVHTLVNDTWLTIGFKVTGLDKVEYYVNNVLVATHTTTIPSELLKLTMAHLTGEGNAATLDIDYIVCYQDR